MTGKRGVNRWHVSKPLQVGSWQASKLCYSRMRFGDNTEVFSTAQRRASVKPEDITLVTGVLLAAIKYGYFQRPEALAHMTIHELEGAEKARKGDNTMFVVRLAHHKTSSKGPAQVVMTVIEHKTVTMYTRYICRRLDPTTH